MSCWTAGHRSVGALTAVAVAGSLWGVVACGAAGDANEGTAAGEVAISPAAGATLAAGYAAKNTAANRSRSLPGILAIEARPLREISLVGQKIDKAAHRAASATPANRSPATFAPRFTGYPRWFVSQSRIDGRADRGELSLFVQRAASAPWLKSLSVGIGATAIAKIDIVGGAAQLPPPAAKVRVRSMTDALTRYLGTGRPDPRLRTKGSVAERIRADVDHERRTGRGKASLKTDCVNEPANEHGVRQAGGTLVLTSIRCTLDLTVLHGGTVTLNGDLTALAASSDHLSGYQLVTEHMVALSVPDAGPALVLGDWNAPVALYSNAGG